MKTVSLTLLAGSACATGEVTPAANVEHEHQRNEREFKTADVDGDGFLSVKELSDAFSLVETHDLVESDQKEFFDKMDDNLDGQVSLQEYRDPMRSFTVLLRKQFEHLDLGTDGSLDDHELAIAQQEEKIDLCDANGDSKIGLTEFIECSLRTLFPNDFVQGNPSEIGVDLEGQPLPQVRLVQPPKGKRYAAAVVARDAHIYDPYIKFQDMKRLQGSLQSVMGEMQDLMKDQGMEMPVGTDMNIMQALGGQMGMGGAPGAQDIGKAQESIDELLKHFDHDQVAADSRKFFGRPSLREMMLERESAPRHLEL